MLTSAHDKLVDKRLFTTTLAATLVKVTYGVLSKGLPLCDSLLMSLQ